jgi:hypothetical protein
MKEYFKKFPKINYTYKALDNTISSAETVDMSVRFKILEPILEQSDSYYDYYWKDEDRVDIVADKYYGDPKLSWIVMLSAEAFDWLYDLPMTGKLFDKYLCSKYKVLDVNTLRSVLHHYEDISGTVIDSHTFDMLADRNKNMVMVYDYEERINEKKRNVKLLSKVHVKDVLNEFDIKLQEIKNNRRLFK